MFDGRTKLSKEVAAEVREHFGDVAYRTVIPRSVRLSEAPSFGEPIEAYDPIESWCHCLSASWQGVPSTTRS